MGDVMITARDFEEMDLESDAFIGEVFAEWALGHFGKRITRELDKVKAFIESQSPGEENATPTIR